MKEKSIILIVSLILLLCIGCTPTTQTSVPLISQDKAIIIAATNVPSSVIINSSVVTRLDDNNWVVYFIISDNITKNELGWPTGSNTTYENLGILPADAFKTLIFNIDGNTGDILSREATDSIPIGGPGVFYTEPSERASIPLWSAILSGIGGLVVGGISIWFIMRRKMRQGFPKSKN